MGNLSVSRGFCPRKTSVRGLSPCVVSAIAVGVMLCGFAVADRDNVPIDNTLKATAAGAVETDLTLPARTPAEQRSLLVSDEDALYDATIWLARCIYSETGRRYEQELVAWVVRNRVETRYRGESTYAGVVLDPFQFSAFNRSSLTRVVLVSLDSTYASAKWTQAFNVARNVILAEADMRPFPITTRHFYSERSLGEADVPLWALEVEPITVHRYQVDAKRFRFFDRVS